MENLKNAALEPVDTGTLEAVQRQSEAVALHQRIVATYQAINMMLTDYCRLLKDMRDKKLYRDLGCKTFDEYVENHAGIKARQAYNYISTYERLGEKRLAEHGSLGITKLSYLAELYPADADALAAENDLAGMSSREVKELVAKAARQGEQLSMLETEKADAEAQEIFYRRETERLAAVNAELAEQLAAAKEAAKAPVVDEQAMREAARQEANRELAERLADEREKAEREYGAALREVNARAAAQLNEAQRKLEAAQAEHDRQLNDATLKRKKAVEAAEKKAAAAAREEALKQAAEDKQKAVEAAVIAAKKEAAAEAEKLAASAAAELEKLKKQLRVAQDKETVRYAVLFDQLQATVNGMRQQLERMTAEGKSDAAKRLADTSQIAMQQLAKRLEV